MALPVLCGPTASGKTACAVALCEAIGGEVVSADAMQVYRRMDIGTAKPTEEEKRGVRHHLLSVLEPSEKCSAAAYAELAKAAIADVAARGRQPVLCGGTGLYIDAVTKPMGFSLESDPALRAELERFGEENGKEALHEALRAVDPDSAKRLHVNDVRRVVRALEVYRLTGVTLTAQMQKDAQRVGDYAERLYALDWPREELYARIDARVEQMVRDGLVGEVEALLASGLPADATAMQALGYKEIAQALRGTIGMAEAIEKIKQGTRHYAKRQLTWFRRDGRVRWLAARGKSAGDIAREILEDFGHAKLSGNM